MNKPSIVILDTDIGYDPDDLFALLYLLRSGCELDLIISGDECEGYLRYQLLRNILSYLERRIPVVAGEYSGSSDFVTHNLIERRYEVETDYLLRMSEILEQIPDGQRARYICIQGAGNLEKILELPGAEDKLEIYLMGGAVDYIRPGRSDWVEHNLDIHPECFKAVLASSVPSHIVMAHTTHNPELEVVLASDLMRALRNRGGVDAMLLDLHMVAWIEAKKEKKIISSFMHDPLTVSVALGLDFVDFNETGLKLTDELQVVTTTEGPLKRWSKPGCRAIVFMSHLQEVLLS